MDKENLKDNIVLDSIPRIDVKVVKNNKGILEIKWYDNDGNELDPKTHLPK